jgi:hypothetical protein
VLECIANDASHRIPCLPLVTSAERRVAAGSPAASGGAVRRAPAAHWPARHRQERAGAVSACAHVHAFLRGSC